MNHVEEIVKIVMDCFYDDLHSRDQRNKQIERVLARVYQQGFEAGRKDESSRSTNARWGQDMGQ